MPELGQCLPGMHAFTGCDTVSDFGKKGKIKTWKLIQQNDIYQNLFGELGNNKVVQQGLYEKLEQFTKRVILIRLDMNYFVLRKGR